MSDRDLTPEEAARRFISKRRNNNTDKTVRSYEGRLRQFLRWVETRDDITVMRDLDGWLLDEYERYIEERGDAPATVKGKLTALKELIRYCVKLEVVDEELFEKVKVPTLDPAEQSDDKKLETDSARKLLSYYRSSTSDYGTIYHVMLELLWHVGGRISCFRALDLGDYDAENRVLRFRSRPPTRLKDHNKHERNVAIPEPVADVLDFWIERERFDKHDDNGRKPLLSTRFGRAADATLQGWAYQATQPCLHTQCPHSKRRETCKFTEKSHASKCPSSRAPHQVRTGSITWQLNRGLSYVKVAERVAASPETIRRYYDKADLDEELARRRPDTDQLDILSQSDSSDEVNDGQ